MVVTCQLNREKISQLNLTELKNIIDLPIFCHTNMLLYCVQLTGCAVHCLYKTHLPTFEHFEHTK